MTTRTLTSLLARVLTILAYFHLGCHSQPPLTTDYMLEPKSLTCMLKSSSQDLAGLPLLTHSELTLWGLGMRGRGRDHDSVEDSLLEDVFASSRIIRTQCLLSILA